jgi:hypothetical protein
MIEVGILKNFNSGTYKAGVQLAGSLTTYFDDISVAKNIPSSALVIGNYVIVAIPGGNPKDACVIATWPAGGAKFLDLSDTPGSYSGQKGRVPIVNIGETALEFVNLGLASLDWPLDNHGDEGDHFKQYEHTYPSGWTEADAALATYTDGQFSFWFFRGSAGNPSWDYRKQTGVVIEDLPSSYWPSFTFGPILFRDGQYDEDVDYYFAVHGETDGAIDLNKYARVHFQWDSAGGIWRARGESNANDGGGETASAWFNLSTYPLIQPIYFRVMVRNDANNRTREYMGIVPLATMQSLFQNVNEITTWGQVYWRISQSRGAGIEDYLYLGAVDYHPYQA